MNYVYDIVLNFNKLYYDFYEWKESDNLFNFKKIPLFKIKESDYLAFKYDDIKIDKSFVSIISGCAYLVGGTSKVLVCLLSNGKEAIGIRLDNNGNVIGRSSLIFDEEEEVLDNVIDSLEYSIKYEIKNKNLDNKIYSRIINEKKEYLLCFFNSNNDIKIYRYIYYDFYEREEKDINKIREKLLDILNFEWNNECERLYQSIRLFNGVR